MAISFLSARSLSHIVTINALRGSVRTKEIWSGKAQRSSRKRLLASRTNRNRGLKPQNTSQRHAIASNLVDKRCLLGSGALCDFARNAQWQHNPRMGDVPNRLAVLDLSSPTGRTSCSSSPREPSTAVGMPEADTVHPSRHVLPRDLDAAIRRLDDEELDRLVSAALEERCRRKKLSVPEESQPMRRIETVALPQGKLNAVRAAFKAGVTPSRIAREFGISKSDVRGALKGDARKQ
jgi:hypothetical protein